MDRDKIEAKLRQILTTNGFQGNGVSFYDDFHRVLNLDSLDAVEFVMCIEEEFDINVQDEDYVKLNSLKSCVDYIENVLTSQSK